MPKNKFKSGSGAKAAQAHELAAPADVDASAHTSLEEQASSDQHPSHEDGVQDHASASTASSRSSPVVQSEEAAEAGTDFVSADEAAAAAFGSEDLGDIGTDKTEAADENDLVMRIPVDWGGEFESSICGLKNAGNTCFLNSVGMLLVHCPGVFWYCMFDLEQKENSDEHYFHSRGRYDDAIKQLVYGVQSEVDAYQPNALIRLTRALMPEYRLGTQQDAHEYMHLLLSAWAEDYGLNPEKFMQSPAYSSFGGCYSQVCHCLTCGEESRKYSADLDISVEIMHYVEETVADPLLLPTTFLIPFLQQSWNVFHDLEECLRSYFKRSKMTGDNQWFCPKCKEKRDSEYGLAVYSPPPFLCVNLKRFSNDVEKINHRVRFPALLSLEPYIDFVQEDERKSSCQYRLSGVLVHHGLTIKDGHYISYCCGNPNSSADGKQAAVAGQKVPLWFKFDDDIVTKVSMKEVLGAEAYILMYTMVPDVLHEDPDVPQYVLPAVMHKETRAAQALSRVDPDSLGDESFGWYTREAVGVVVALWTLLLGIIMCAHFFASRRAVDIFHMYNSRNSVQESAHIVLNFFTSTENDYIGIMVVPLLLGMAGFLRSISYGLNDGGFSGFRSAVLGYLCGFMFHVACCVALSTMFKGEKSSAGETPSSSSTPTVMGRWSSDDHD